MKVRRSMTLVKEWRDRFDAAKADPHTTPEELRELVKMGIDIIDSGLEIVIPFLDDEDLPESLRKIVLKLMADIPVFREINGIV